MRRLSDERFNVVKNKPNTNFIMKAFNTIKYYLIILFYQIIKFKFKLPTSLIVAQSAHETGYWTSDIFKENRNMFGMKKATKRKRNVEGESRGHALYKSIWQSIDDYFLRQEEFKVNSSDKDTYILQTVNSNYAEDELYITKWQATHKETYKYIKRMFAVTGIIFGSALILILYPLTKKKNGKKSTKRN